MPEFLQDVKAGDPYPASARLWNALIDAARARLAKRYSTGGDPKGESDRSTVAALVKNDTGSDIAWLKIMGLDTTVVHAPATYPTQFKQWPVLVGKTPAIADHFGRWCVTLEPIANGNIGWCAVGGVVPVQVNIGSASHKFCDVYDASAAKLKSDWHGAGRILYQAGASGDQWCAVLIGSVTYRFSRCNAILKGALSGATGTVDNVASIQGASPVAAAADELTVYNTLGWTGDDNGDCMIEWDVVNSRWQFYQVECPA